LLASRAGQADAKSQRRSDAARGRHQPTAEMGRRKAGPFAAGLAVPSH
jgi:hypothetical protein